MRSLIVLLLLVFATDAAARNLYVVIYTSDGLAVNYRCVNQDPGVNNEATAIRRVVHSQGRVSWHAVGGMAPYTAIKFERGAGGAVCITVIDAAGNVATGCGVAQVLTQEVGVNCALGEAPNGLLFAYPKERKEDPESKVGMPAPPRRPLTERNSEVGESPSMRRTPTGAAGGGGMQREFPARREVTTGGGGTGGGGVRNIPSAPQRKF